VCPWGSPLDVNCAPITSFIKTRTNAGVSWCVPMMLRLYVSFAKEPYKSDYILQKRPIILRSLLVCAQLCSYYIFYKNAHKRRCQLMQTACEESPHICSTIGLWRDSFMCAITHSYATQLTHIQRDLFMCKMRSFIWSVRVTWRIHRDVFISKMTYSYDLCVWHDAFTVTC